MCVLHKNSVTFFPGSINSLHFILKTSVARVEPTAMRKIFKLIFYGNILKAPFNINFES